MFTKALRFAAYLLLSMLACERGTAAPLIFEEPFNSWNQTLWAVSYRTAPSTTVIQPVTIGDNTYLQFRRTRTGESPGGSANAFLSYKGHDDFVEDGKLADFKMELIIRMGEMDEGAGPGSGSIGFAFRSAAAGYNNNVGYYLAVNFKDGALTLYKNPIDHTKYGTLVKSVTDFTLSSDVDYKLTLHVEGASIIASLWTLDGTEALTTLSIDDAENINAGLFGLRAHFWEPGQNAYFRDLKMETIPEPSHLALIGAIALGLLSRRRHR